ncbi:serine hydrolase domain-containing protein [Sphingomonas sp. AX6]|uniref:serine hydrolase domain-containing protein n=1 Tax=Sphingomonas sp. AX6 TaxID=2653171 RepID=UPI0012F2909D|nr:serine hydrolase domain-containing protein [Sphingomonas sp. AX6]VXC47127.1 Beta-lactamase [Sphingomonas sp. AX6]
MARRTMMLMAGLVALALSVGAALSGGDGPDQAASRSASDRAMMRHPADPVEDGRPSLVDYRRLDDRIVALMRDPDMVGLAVGTIEMGQVRFAKGYGETLAGSGSAVTPDTVFRWASLSKGVAAALVVGLAEEKRLSLDAPVAASGTTLTLPGGVTSISVADILSHRTGLVRNAWDDRLEAGEDPKALRAALGSLPPYCPPGTCHAYQNIAFDAAAEIVERASGRDYARFAADRLFAPLGMTRTSIGRAGLERAPSWARPHRRGRVPTIVNDNYYRVPAAGGVNASIRDLLLWMRAQLAGAPEILSPAAIERMQRPIVATPPRGRRGAMDRALTDAGYGLGWRTFTYAGRKLVGHRGSVDGYGALILFDPLHQSGIVMLWNSNQPKPARLQLEFMDMLYGLPPTDWLELDQDQQK